MNEEEIENDVRVEDLFGTEEESEPKKYEPVPWEDGIIGKVESFLRARYPIGPMWARAVPSVITSMPLCNVVLYDAMGIVKPNIWILYVGKSGLGCKTPVINFAREIMRGFNSDQLAIPKFSPEGFTEWVMGVEKKDREPIKPHPANLIIRDEFSKLLGETKYHPHLATMKEFLSLLTR